MNRIPYGWLRQTPSVPQRWTHPSFQKSKYPYHPIPGYRLGYQVGGDLVPQLCAVNPLTGINMQTTNIDGVPVPTGIPCLINNAELRKAKDNLQTAVNQADAVSNTCTSLTDQEKSGWEDYKKRFTDFYNSQVATSILHPQALNPEYDKALDFERELPNWQNIFKTKCGLPGPVTIPTPPGGSIIPLPPGITNPITDLANKASGVATTVAIGAAAVLGIMFLAGRKK